MKVMSGPEFERLYESAMRVEEMCASRSGSGSTDGGRHVVVVNGAGECEVVRKRLENVTTARMSKASGSGRGRWVGASTWSSEEMLRYVYMGAEERKVYRGLKLRFRATGEFE